MALTVRMIVQALERIGRPATAVEIRDKLMQMFPDAPMGKTPLQTVRARLQENSSSSGQYKRRQDLFRRVTPVEQRIGIWMLRPSVTSANEMDERISGPEHVVDEVEVDMAEEGSRFLREHLVRERDAQLVRKFKESLDVFKCVVCNFDFETVYGEIGSGFIEAHHTIPISKGKRLSSVKDLVAVCSNCHRMLHKNSLMDWQELRTVVNQQKQPQ